MSVRTVDYDALVIGESLIDVVVRESGVGRYPGGSPLNVAVGLGRLGHRTLLLTHIADDLDGQMIANHLLDSDVDLSLDSFSAARTSTARATIGASGSAEYEFDVEWAIASPPVLPRAKVIHSGSVAAFMQPGASTVERVLATTDGVVLSFDPNIRPSLLGSHRDVLAAFERYCEVVDVLKLSDEDATWLYPTKSLSEVLDSALARGVRLVVGTKGAEGAVVVSRAGHAKVAARASKVVDTVGAGDAFMSSLISSVIETGLRVYHQDELQRIGEQAALAAAITVSRSGALPPTRHELESGVGSKESTTPQRVVRSASRTTRGRRLRPPLRAEQED